MIFNDPAFHALNGVEPTTYGCLTGVWKDGVFENGYSAPFAGFDIPDDTPPWRVQEMVQEAVHHLEDGVRIKLPPPCYTPTWHAQVKALLDLGFRVERSEINQHMDIKNPSPSRNGLRALKAAKTLDLYIGMPAHDRAAYDVLKRNREAKGRELRLSFDYIQKAKDAIDVRWIAVEDDRRCVASALVYVMGKKTALVVYWGDDPDHGLPCSPMPLLADYLCSWNFIHTLDLGISTDPGLMQFKRSVGAKEGLRLDMVRGI